MSILSDLHFHNEEAAYEWIEARLWPNGAQCPRCKGTDRVGKLQGKSTRIGVYKCYACKKPFSVKVGTIFEDSHIPLHKWLQAIHLVCSSKKGISANQLHRTLKITLKSAWFLGHRIREAMRTGDLSPMGGAGAIVEVDETFIGKKDTYAKRKNSRSYHHKQAALSLVERGGEVRSFKIDMVSIGNIKPIVDANIYQHCDEKHLHRYLAEFDFRYNNRVAKGVHDEQRAEKALLGVKGKRLTYKGADQKEADAQIN